MAEAVAAVAVVSSILTLIDAGKSFLSLVHALRQQGHDLSDAISDAEAQIPLLLDLVKKIQDDALLIQKGQSNLLVALDGCNRQIRLLTELVTSNSARTTTKSALEATRIIWRRLRRGPEVQRIQQSLEHYKTLLILSLVQHTQSQSMNSTSGKDGDDDDHPNYFHLPSVLLPKFVGRRAALKEIDDSWKLESVQAGITSNCTTVILGMGGQGKTQLAQEYCRFARRNKKFKAIFWVDASSSDSIFRSYTDIAYKLAPDNETAPHSERSSSYFATKAISKLRVPWLLVLDNFDNPKAFRNLEDFLPHNPDGFGAFLFTSRHHDVSSLGTTIVLGGMTESEGVELFFHRLGQSSSLISQHQAAAVVARLGGLPLAIDQAASFMRRHRLGLEGFDKILEDQSLRSQLWTSFPHTWGYFKEKRFQNEALTHIELSIATTFELSLQQIEIDYPEWAGVGSMLSFLCLFDRNCISEELAVFAKEPSTGLGAECMQLCYTDGKWDRMKFQALIVELYGLSIIENIDFGGEFSAFTLHPMVREWLRLRIDPNQRFLFADMAVSVVNDLIEQHAENVSDLDCKCKEWLLANLTSARESAWSLKGENQVLCSMTQDAARRFANFYTHCERLEFAMELYESLLEHTKNDEQRVERFDIYHDAASCLVEMSRFAEAEELYRKAVEGKTTLLGPDHKSTLNSAQKLGLTYRRSLHYAEGEAILLDVIKRASIVHGQNTLLYLVALNSLAVNLRYQKRLLDAEKAAREAFRGVIDNFGPHSYTSFFVRRCLALVLRDQGRLAEASTLLRDGLASQERVLGSLHSSTLFTVSILEGMYEVLGDGSQVQLMRDKMHGDLGRAILQASSWSTDR
jgi:tetratricopeptide (TPR) repeat protein